MRKLNEFDATRYVDVILFVAVVLFSLDFATLARCGRHLLELDVKQNCICVSKKTKLQQRRVMHYIGELHFKLSGQN